MRKNLLVVTIALVLLLVGCTQAGDRIYTICRIENDTTYVYNAAGEFFTYSNGKVQSCYPGDLKAQPILVMCLPEPGDYTITKTLPTVYHATFDDTMRYIATVLVNDSAEYTVTQVDWKSFTMYIRNESYTMRLYYTDDNTLRLYMQDGSTPHYLQ